MGSHEYNRETEWCNYRIYLSSIVEIDWSCPETKAYDKQWTYQKHKEG